MVFVHIGGEFLHSLRYSCFQLAVRAFLACGSGDNAVKILFGHCNGTANKVAQIVGKVIVVACNNILVGNGTVGSKWHFSQCVIPYAVNSEMLRHLVGVYNIAF